VQHGLTVSDGVVDGGTHSPAFFLLEGELAPTFFKGAAVLAVVLAALAFFGLAALAFFGLAALAFFGLAALAFDGVFFAFDAVADFAALCTEEKGTSVAC
jgi:hypothetical protein